MKRNVRTERHHASEDRGHVWEGWAEEATIPIAECMNRDVPYLRANVRVDSAIQFLRARRLDQVVVVDDHGRPVGFVSESDLRDEDLFDGDEPVSPRSGPRQRLRVRDVMLPYVPVIAAETPLSRVAATVLSGAGALVVVERDGTLAGALGSADIADWLAQRKRESPDRGDALDVPAAGRAI